MKRICVVYLIFSILLTISGCTHSSDLPPSQTASAPAISSEVAETAVPRVSSAPELPQREKDWLEDIEFLREECKTKHIDPFYLCSEEEFDFKLDQLAKKVGELSDSDITLEIVSIVASLGDPHSFVALPMSFYERLLPIGIKNFDGKMYLYTYLADFEQFAPYLLHEIVAVNGVDISYLIEKASSLGNPFNRWLNLEMFETYSFIPAFFDWAGCDYTEGYTFQILNDNGEVESVEVPVVSYEEFSQDKWKYTEEYDTLLYLKGFNRTAYVEGQNSGCVYLSLAQLRWKSDIQRMIRESGELLAEYPDCNKLVIDLRQCPGGHAEYVECFREDAAKALETEHTYVLTSGVSASAALTYIAYFKDNLNAVTVGEPTGQFTSMFHMQSSLDEASVLPHSQISVQFSNAWWDGDPIVGEQYDENGRLYAWESTILPDVYVYQDIEDIRQGKDSVIEWVLRQ